MKCGWTLHLLFFTSSAPHLVTLYLGNERSIKLFPVSGSNPTRFEANDYSTVLEYTTQLDPVYYTTSENTVYKFHPTDDTASSKAGMLDTITDRNGNTVTLSYEPGRIRDRISQVADGLGNTLYFYYYDNANAPLVGASSPSDLADLLWKVVDHAGREVEYKYDFSTIRGPCLEIRQLTEVILPAHNDSAGIVLPSEHERFPNGRSLKYEYYPDGDDFTGLLTKVINENGVEILENVYSNPTTNDYEDEWSRRLYKQTFAGETYTHMLTSQDGSDVDPWTDDEDFAVWVQKRNGSVVKLVYSAAYIEHDYPNGYHLLSRTDYPGTIPSTAMARGNLVWFDETEGVNGQWYYADTPFSTPVQFSGPTNQKRPNDLAVTKQFSFTDEWRLKELIQPNGDRVEYVYKTGPNGEPLEDARSRQTLTDIISKPFGTSSSEWITMSFENEFSFWPGTFGSCGCGPISFATAEIDGKGNRTERVYFTENDGPFFENTGNLKSVFYDIPQQFAGIADDATRRSHAAASEHFTYDASGNMTSHTHSAVTRLVNGMPESYDRVDEFEYFDSNHSNTSSRGKLHIERIDANGESLETTYEYDSIGNVSKIIESDGDVTIYLYNQGRQLVREQSWDTNETVLYAQIDYLYDANGNVVIEKEANLDEIQVEVANIPVITTVYQYDDLDQLIKKSTERGDVQNESITENSYYQATPPEGADWVTQVWAYDENSNLLRFEDGDAVANAGTSFNIVEYEYDHRDLLYRRIEGSGSTNELVVQFDYDKNKRLVNRTTNPDSINGQHQTEQFFYDGHDRMTGIVDPMGNSADFTYDDNHNQLSVQICGPIDDDTQGADAERALYLEETEYDSRDRVIEKRISVFDFLNGTPADCSFLPAGTQIQSTLYTYNENSSIRQVDAPSGEIGVLNTTEYFYDSVGRLAYVEDGLDNAVEYGYDQDSNISRIDQHDLSSAGSGLQTFITTYNYDSLDRRINRTDSALNQTQWRYDSRSNLVEEIDGRGNITSYDYDGLNRMVTSSVRMTDTGDASGTQISGPDGTIETTYIYDDSSRLISETDDNGHTTSYEYDAANRRTSITMPVTSEVYLTEYNGNGVASKITDARGVVLDLTYDHNNRLTRREVNAAGTIPDGSQFEDFTYDGLGRVTIAENLLTKVTRSYDSRGFVVREIQNADGGNMVMDRVVDYGFDLANNTTRILYPHGRDIQRSYDSINRLIGIEDVQNTPVSIVTAIDYFGQRLERRVNGNGTETSYAYDGYELFPTNPDDKGFGRVIGITTTDSGSSAVLDNFAFTWDESQNRTSYKDVGSGMKNRRERSFGYDSSDRLVSTDVDFPEPGTDFTSPTNSGITDYDLDGVHNRYEVSGFEEAGAPIGIYKDASVDVPIHVSNNQYTFSPREGGGEWVYDYDANGNMILKAEYNVADFTGDYHLNFADLSAFMAAYGAQDPSADLNGDEAWNFIDVSAFLAAYGQSGGLDNQHYTYDFRNQLIDIEFKSGNAVNHTVTNTYDAFARRLVEAANDGPDIIEKQMVYGCASLWEVIEIIQLAEGANPEKLLTTHVYGIGIDDEVSYRIEDLANPEDYWAHRDDLNSLTSVTDVAGDVKERYEYGDFGNLVILDPVSGIERLTSSVGAVHYYTGRSRISGTTLFDFRFRVLDVETGKFVQRDPLEYIDSMNMYAYVINNSYIYTDPFGLELKPEGGTGARILLKVLDVVAPQWAIDAGTGAADGVGIIPADGIRKTLGIEDGVNKDGGVYKTGEVVGIIGDTVSGGGAAKQGAKKGLGLLKRVRCFFTKSCFVAGTLVATEAGGEVPIEQIQVGQVVQSADDGLQEQNDIWFIGEGLTDLADPDSWDQIIPESWSLVEMRVDFDDGVFIMITALRPNAWVGDLVAGDEVGYYREGAGVIGNVEILSITDCPELPVDTTGVVRAVYETHGVGAVNLWVSGTDGPIGVTTNHPIFSIDRDGWFEAGELFEGEHLATAGGSVTVDSIELRSEESLVYNFEIHGDHTYFVSEIGLWVHNGGDGYTVYIGDDGYVGHTNDFARREAEHARDGRRITPLHENIPDRDTALGVEQHEIDARDSKNNGPNSRNAINPNRTDDVASARRAKGAEYLKAKCP